jgi:hypothetical protein
MPNPDPASDSGSHQRRGESPALAEFCLPEDHPLSDDPEIALILGYCLSEWELIEYAMVFVFAGLLEADDYHQVERVFWSQQSLSGRRKMILELCQRKGLIYKEENETIISYMKNIKALSEKRNLLAHGVWYKDYDKQSFFRLKLRPGMVWDLLDEKKRFTKEAIKAIGQEFTAFRRDFRPFAIRYYGAKLQKMVEERMAVAEALNRGVTIKLGPPGEADQGAVPVK